jgi:hypothetical protein
MSRPASLLGQARAFARDFPRDQMPGGYLWDVVDYVPVIIDAGLTGRGGWPWGSDVLGGDPTGGILASFTSGDKLLIVAANNHWYEVDQTTGAAVDRGASDTIRQNPIQAGTTIVSFDSTGANVPQLITAPGGTFTPGRMDASAPHAPVGTYYKSMVVVGGTPSEPNVVRFSVPGAPTSAWDSLSNLVSRAPITGLAALRAVAIIFHAGTTERIRGSTPSHTGFTGDMITEPLFDRVGCTDPRSIAYWQDNCVFADEHGVHMTDGAVIRNIASQGSILYYWRMLYSGQVSLAACTFLDYYIITVRRNDGSATTLICDLNRRQWFRFANVYALSYVASTGGLGMERVWAGMAGTGRLARIGPTFFPVTTSSTLVYDADGRAVLPTFETGWSRMGREGRKRARFAYLSYDSRITALQRKGLGDGLQDPDEGPPFVPPDVLAAVTPVLEFGFITSPQDLNYTVMGGLPPTSQYTRYRLPISRGPYGVAFRVRQTQPTTVTRIFDLAVDAQGLEPSTL